MRDPSVWVAVFIDSCWRKLLPVIFYGVTVLWGNKWFHVQRSTKYEYNERYTPTARLTNVRASKEISLFCACAVAYGYKYCLKDKRHLVFSSHVVFFCYLSIPIFFLLHTEIKRISRLHKGKCFEMIS